MKLKRNLIGIFAAVAAFALGVGVSSGLRFVLSYSPMIGKGSETSERAIPLKASTTPERFPVGSPPGGVRIAQTGPHSLPSGKYHLDQNFNREFTAFDSIYFPTQAFGYGALISLSAEETEPKAFVQGTAVSFDSILIDGNEILFRTETVRGVSYIFAGTSRHKATCGIDVDTPGLDGRLIKIRDGELVAVIRANFHLVCGC